MPYYKGDYYRGDNYYRGDFLGIGKALKSIGKFAYNTIVPAPIRAGIAGVQAVIKGGAARAPFVLPPAPSMGMVPLQQAGLININPGGGPQTGLINVGTGGQLMQNGRHRAMHLNRETYVTRGGGTSRWPQSLMVHPKGTEAVPSRHMNVGNAKALKRSLRRISGFARLARRVMTFTHPKGAGKGRFKFGRKRSR